MKIIIYQNREVYKEESKIGNDSENKVETLEFEFPAEYEDFTKYIEFQIKGGKYVDLIDNNKYVITREVAKYGKIKTQIVLKKNTENDVMVFKSDIFTLNVSNSINATENLVNTVGVDLIEKIVTKNNEQDTRLDILEADNLTNKENISSIQDRQVTQDNRIDDLEADNTSNKSRITDIETKNVEQDNKIVSLESKNTEQDTNIQKNTADIKTINEKNKSQDTEITNIKSEQATQNTNIQNNTKSIEEINKKDSTQDNLIEELQTKLEEVEAENVSLKKQIPSGEEVGNPIHLSDSSDIECEIVPIGNAEQETREGYNILNPTNLTLFNFNKYISTIDYLSTGAIEVDSNTTYSLIRKKDGTFTDAGFYVYDSNNSNKTSASAESIVNGNYKVTKFTTKSDSKYFGFYFGETEKTYTSVEECLLQNEMMLLKGDYSTGTIPKYEQYGAMPSPNYLSKVVTVGQNVNIFDKDNVENGYFYTNIKVANANWCNYETTELIAGQTYTTSGGRCIISFFNGDTNISYQDITDKTITVPENTNKVYISVPIESINTFKIEAGTIATPYSPYGQGSVEIEVCNKNLAKINEKNWELTENNTIKNKAQNNGTYLTTIKIKKGSRAKICLSLFSKPNTATTFICWIDGEVKTSNSFINFNNYDLNKIYSTNIVAEKDIEIKYQNSGNKNSEIFKFQFWAEIDEETDYIPHESYTKILPIQQEMLEDDYIENIEYHTWGKVVLTGNEDNWQWNSGNFAFISVPNIANKPINQVLVKSNYFLGIEVGSNGTNYVDKDNVVFSWFSGALICIKSTQNFTNIEETKAFLQEKYNSGNPVVVYYKLATPKALELTEEQKSILNSFHTYKGITNVSMSGIGTLKVNYKKDLETIINNLATATVALGGNINV